MDRFMAAALAEIDEMGLNGPLLVPPAETFTGTSGVWPPVVICSTCHKPADRWETRS